MSRTGWKIEKNIDGLWVDDGTVNRPNENFERSKSSTMSKIPLNNGTMGYMTFKNKSLDMPLSFSWIMVNKTFVDKIDAYVDDNTELKITDHFDKEYKGMFIDNKPEEITGKYPSKFDMMATFEIMPNL